MRHAVYAGSFDPITNGHLWMIEHGSRVFDQLTVAIGVNPDKKYRFSLDDRLAMLRESTAHLSNVRIADFENLFLVHYAKQIGAGFILRGIRNEQDYGYERGMRYVNGEFDLQINSVFLMPPREYAEISSSFVKGLVGPAGWQEVLAKYVPPCVHRHFLIQSTATRPAAPAPKTDSVLPQIMPGLEARYREPHRHYHTLAHIDSCLTLFGTVRDQFADPDAALFAIWFHDAIYDPTRADNEEASAEFAASELAAVNVPISTIKNVRTLILATRHEAVPPTGDAARLADIDLAILAADPEEFDRYERNIRLEYAHVPEAAFRTGRRAILERFLSRERIYCCEPFATRFEARARVNLKRSVQSLTA